MEALEEGLANRVVASTAMNAGGHSPRGIGSVDACSIVSPVP